MKKLIYVVAAIIIAVGTAGAMEVTLRWDANTEPDLAGYKIYHDANSGEPYMDVVDVGNVTEHTLVLPDGVRYFVVTAYDSETPSLESDYSNEVFVAPGVPVPPIVEDPPDVTITVTVTINTN